ncbi:MULTISPECIES: hypothetical protein [Burkholderia]|uniref:hypothetical protein n=1 Tax=Burkholderia TaxID=32008 RepID=UPI00075A9953|nr:MULTISPECIES: hypothetical protein [Burkholderia]AOJ69191.1 hypothetical protein WS78_10810 [Burkholderia savannae]KVG39830.1 hypothetical protein WS77_19360 [Burkholderia sp. MSMB0265]KVG85758.1 hypothetical protein WS81_31315 [Burkholderia sp. MSMB2040]KVG92226.1 hypothetical protein WS82_12335 [Burkholderia sp. MSMB2041]KVG95695.1 hypothetical protein WS83_03900 [Burkholderia sp. MSMB2042]
MTTKVTVESYMRAHFPASAMKLTGFELGRAAAARWREQHDGEQPERKQSGKNFRAQYDDTWLNLNAQQIIQLAKERRKPKH